MKNIYLEDMISMCGSRDTSGRVIVMVHKACGRPVFSCEDPACVGELHHYEPCDDYNLGTCEYSVPEAECIKVVGYND